MSSIERYKSLLRNLLPQGIAWEKVKDHPLIEGLATEFSRVGDRADDLLGEIDPKTTSELLTDWETMLALPDETTPESPTLQQRRAQIVQKLATKGSLSKLFYEELGRFYGFEIRVTNIVPFQAGKSCVGQHLTNTERVRKTLRVGSGTVGERLRVFGWSHYFGVALPITAADFFSAGQSRVGDKLAVYGNRLLENTIRKLKPAHAGVFFTFFES
jgi:uncharacterized protein YmfQ (DUF2313 family)